MDSESGTESSELEERSISTAIAAARMRLGVRVSLLLVAAVTALVFTKVCLDNVHGSGNAIDPNGVTNLDIEYRIQTVTEQCGGKVGVCLCSDGYTKTGVNPNGENIFAAGTWSQSGCQVFHFQVGDVIFLEKSEHIETQYIPSNMAGFIAGSKIIHSGIIDFVPADASNASQIMVTEAVAYGVIHTDLKDVLARWPWGGLRMRRVGPQFPQYFLHAQSIQAFLLSQRAKSFDEHIYVPLIQRTSPGYVDPTGGINGLCKERARGYEMYKNGGPKQWDCSQLVIWTLAFPGGLNVDYNDAANPCPGQPNWALANLQEWPSKLYHEASVWDASITLRMPCNTNGCYLGGDYATANSPGFKKFPFASGTAAATGWNQAAFAHAASTCPASHPFAYHTNNAFCCKTNKEKVSGEGAMCDGSVINAGGVHSMCCENDDSLPCTVGVVETSPCSNYVAQAINMQ